MISLQFNPINFDITSFNASLTNGIALVTSLIAVSLTESRMGRSRGKISFVRICAPIGTIGFIGILKVHIGTLVSLEFAKELNLPVLNYASATRIGSVRKMHRSGIKWDEAVNCLAIGMDDTIPLKVSDAFTFVNDDQVKYISTAKKVELVNTNSVEWNRRYRGFNIFINVVAQSILCFLITISSELGANRKRPTLALFFCASVVLTEIVTAFIEWMWTAVSTQAAEEAIGQRQEDPYERRVESLRIYEQKLQIAINRSQLRQYEINRLVQIHTRGFEKSKKGAFLLDKAKQSLKRAEERPERNEAVYKKSKARLIKYAFRGSIYLGVVLVICEIFTYTVYVTTSFTPKNSPLNDVEQQESLYSLGKWFLIQLVGFFLKAIAPYFDRLLKRWKIRRSRYNIARPLHQTLPERELLALDIPGHRGLNCRWIKQGRIRAGNTNGILLQTIEQSNSSLPLAHSSIIYFINDIVIKTVVPQVLLVSGLNAGEFLNSLQLVNPRNDYLAHEDHDRFRRSHLHIDRFLNAHRGRNGPEMGLDERHGFVMVLQFLPYPNRETNQALFVRVAVLTLENIKESYHYRIVTSSGVRSGKRAYATDFLVWDGNRPAYGTTYQEAAETNVLTFSAAHVNESVIKEALLETRPIDASAVPLPRGWSPPTFDLDGISTSPDFPPRNNPSPRLTPTTHHSSLPDRACLFEILEKNELERSSRRRNGREDDDGINDYGFQYIGRFYLENCFIHRYHTLITAQGRLTEAHAQLYNANRN